MTMTNKMLTYNDLYDIIEQIKIWRKNKMHYTNPVYRPPFEANSLLLEVTVGCSHNACTFCTMYSCQKFRVAPIEQIESDLLEARQYYKQVKRIFLVNGDPFALSAEKLLIIGKKINEIFPEVETISMYASIKNIRTKTDEELRNIRAQKMNDFNIGIESGMDSVLHHFNKGFTLEEAREQLQRLKKAGIDYSVNIMLGAAGEGKWKENATANAKFVNEIEPRLIFLATLHVDAGSPLEEELKTGKFVENTLGENVQEELVFLKGLELKNTVFFGLHTSNVVPVAGQLPVQKQQLIEYIEERYSKIPERIRNLKPEKGMEGKAILY